MSSLSWTSFEVGAAEAGREAAFNKSLILPNSRIFDHSLLFAEFIPKGENDFVPENNRSLKKFLTFLFRHMFQLTLALLSAAVKRKGRYE
jgi:hypothetical protein